MGGRPAYGGILGRAIVSAGPTEVSRLARGHRCAESHVMCEVGTTLLHWSLTHAYVPIKSGCVTADRGDYELSSADLRRLSPQSRCGDSGRQVDDRRGKCRSVVPSTASGVYHLT